MNIKERQNAVVEDFALFSDWEQKYEYIIELGKSLEPLPEEFRAEQFLIKGCQSQVWISVKKQEDRLFFMADADGILPKGIVALLLGVYSGFSAKEILAADFEFISAIGLQEFLSPTRANGLMAMVQQIKYYALAYQMKL